jgi:two-component system, NtrC family, response regulator AtoC
MRDFGVLVVDDEEEASRRLARALAGEFRADTAGTGAEALQKLAEASYELVLLDHLMPGMSGLEVLRKIKQEQPQTPVIMVTAQGDLSLAIDCMKSGAEDFVVKPIVLESLKQKIRALAERRELAAENRRLRAQLDQHLRFDDLVGESRPFTEMLAKIQQVAGLSIPVLIHGESGTGKELVARAIHRNSPRRDRLFLGVNCGAFPDTLLASELFGHVKGAFTDAREARPGLFAAADRGTLFLDEIGESSAGVQVKLLRALEAGEVLPVGSATPRKVDTRIVAATNRDLEQEVREGRFRQDLFYRLWKFPVRVPPLRERQEDIPQLAGYFLARYSSELNKRVREFSADALRLLAQYHWPGNVRELQNVVERAVIVANSDTISPEHLLLGTSQKSSVPGAEPYFTSEWQEAKAEFERAYLIHRLRESGGNISEAARAAGMDRRNFRDKLQALGITAEQYG